MRKLLQGLLLNIIGIIALAWAGWSSTALAALSPSRAPWAGCTWHSFEGLGVRLLVQICTSDTLHYIYSVNGDWIEQRRPFDNRTFGAHQLIRVLNKPASMPIEQAVFEFVSPTLPREALGHCAVAKADTSIRDDQKILLTIQPVGAYARRIEAELKQGPRDFGCGEYGAGQQSTYFEYHPNESKTRFLFVIAGVDEPLFDEQSIQISDAPP